MLEQQLTVQGLVTELSDHDAQMLDIHLSMNQTQNHYTQYKRKFNKENFSTFLKLIQSETWSAVYQAPVHMKYDVFFDTFIYYFNVSFPKIKTRIKRSNNNNWVSEDLRKYKNEIISLSQTLRVSRDRTLMQKLKEQKRNYRIKAAEVKSDYIHKKILNSDNRCKTIWNIINNETKPLPEKKNVSKILVNGHVKSDPYVISNAFNDYFINIVRDYVTPNMVNHVSSAHTVSQGIPPLEFRVKPLTEIEMEKIISSFKNKFSAGYDEVPMPVIKSAKDQLVKPLTHIINSSFITGIFPNKLKISKVKTVFKKGNTLDPSNYRPLSILPTFSKLYERAMYLRLTEFLESNKLHDNVQHGFRSGKSVITASIEFIEAIVDAVDRGEHVVGIFMDICKAFDSVLHESLIKTLEGMGLTGIPLDWIKSYLKERKQFVETPFTNDFNQLILAKSSVKTIVHGVPQGSILGPLLFICYLNGLPKTVPDYNVKMCLYADDANLIIMDKSLQVMEELANNCLISMNNYLSNKNLLLNRKKTNFMQFKTRQKKYYNNPDINIEQTKINQLQQTKFLGLVLDEDLSWDNHILTIQKRVSSGLFVLRSLSKFCTVEVLKIVYFAHIHSHISFGIALYGATSERNLQNLLLLQKKAIRIILNLQQSDSVKEHFSNLRIITVYGLYIFETVMAVRCASGRLPKLGTSHNYSTRNRNQLAAPKSKLQFKKKNTLVAGIKFFNSIPKYIVGISNDMVFKNRFKDYLISKSLYSFDEFFQ